MQQEQPTLPAILETGSLVPSIENLSDLLRSLPARLDDEQLALCDRIADSPVPRWEPVEAQHLVERLRTLDSLLPRRKADALSGELNQRVYVRALRHMPKAQIDFLWAEAVRTLEWFPTVKQCLDIAGKWTGKQQAENIPALAASKSDRERFARLQDARRRLKDEVVEQDWIDALTPGQRKVLETETLLMREGEDGPYRQHPVQIERVRKWHEFQAAQEA